MKFCKFTTVLSASFLWVALALLSYTVQADLVVGNLDRPIRSATPIASLEYWAAQSFSTGGDEFQLNSIEAMVGNGDSSPAVIAELRRSDINGEIDATAGGLLTTFLSPDMSGPAAARMFLPNDNITLSSTDRYWFMLGSGNAGTFALSYAQDGITTGPGILSTFAFSNNGGAAWTYSTESELYMIQVNGTAIPEPSSLVLASAVALTTLLRRRRRQG